MGFLKFYLEGRQGEHERRDHRQHHGRSHTRRGERSGQRRGVHAGGRGKRAVSYAEWWREIDGWNLTPEKVITARAFGDSVETDLGVRECVQSCPDPGKVAAILKERAEIFAQLAAVYQWESEERESEDLCRAAGIATPAPTPHAPLRGQPDQPWTLRRTVWPAMELEARDGTRLVPVNE